MALLPERRVMDNSDKRHCIYNFRGEGGGEDRGMPVWPLRNGQTQHDDSCREMVRWHLSLGVTGGCFSSKVRLQDKMFFFPGIFVLSEPSPPPLACKSKDY